METRMLRSCGQQEHATRWQRVREVPIGERFGRLQSPHSCARSRLCWCMHLLLDEVPVRRAAATGIAMAHRRADRETSRERSTAFETFPMVVRVPSSQLAGGLHAHLLGPWTPLESRPLTPESANLPYPRFNVLVEFDDDGLRDVAGVRTVIASACHCASLQLAARQHRLLSVTRTRANRALFFVMSLIWSLSGSSHAPSRSTLCVYAALSA